MQPTQLHTLVGAGAAEGTARCRERPASAAPKNQPRLCLPAPSYGRNVLATSNLYRGSANPSKGDRVTHRNYTGGFGGSWRSKTGRIRNGPQRHRRARATLLACESGTDAVRPAAHSRPQPPSTPASSRPFAGHSREVAPAALSRVPQPLSGNPTSEQALTNQLTNRYFAHRAPTPRVASLSISKTAEQILSLATPGQTGSRRRAPAISRPTAWQSDRARDREGS